MKDFDNPENDSWNSRSEKQYNLATDIVGNCFIEGSSVKFGMFDKMEEGQVIRIIEELNRLYDENEQLKRELQNIYNMATLNKAISIIEAKYDNYLYDNDTDCIPCKRKAYIECLELLDDFRDDLNG